MSRFPSLEEVYNLSLNLNLNLKHCLDLSVRVTRQGLDFCTLVDRTDAYRIWN